MCTMAGCRSRICPDSDMTSEADISRDLQDAVVGDALRNGRILVADSESDDVQNPGWEMGIRIGDAQTGWVTEFIVYQWGDPRSTAGNGAEFVAVDVDGNLYGGEPSPRRLQKYMRVR